MRIIRADESLFHLIETRGLVKPGSHVFHFALELGVSRRLKAIAGAENYEAFDVIFSKVRTGPVCRIPV